MKTRDLALVGLFVALTGIGAQIRISIGPVPFTLQVLFVILAGLVLGAKLGFLAILLYDAIGILGVPVFSGFSGGFGVLLGPTAGYIVAFPIAAFLSGLKRDNKKVRIVFSYLGLAVIYILGFLWLAKYLGGNYSLALKVGVIPFVVPDVIKVAIALIVADRLGRLNLL
ncbi:biotin transporter BioY [Pyrococcus sp. ST04]|uniref:biotin transporter BioY n=1 Tax=Pyrococcus sp. ST04 TaxID=1183377 RepID=UPI0002605915|nr:biotin transporter BioY [Pyrococcus sp. ST04]AFK21702.1 putative biotin biosynthesis protein [Pyrococcus sp. ST04]